MLTCIIRRPLVHWDTAVEAADAITQLFSSGKSVVICIIGTNRKTTRRSFERHLGHTGNTLAANNSFSHGIPVYTGDKVPGTLECHWKATESPLAQVRGYNIYIGGHRYSYKIRKIIFTSNFLCILWFFSDCFFLIMQPRGEFRKPERRSTRDKGNRGTSNKSTCN